MSGAFVHELLSDFQAERAEAAGDQIGAIGAETQRFAEPACVQTRELRLEARAVSYGDARAAVAGQDLAGESIGIAVLRGRIEIDACAAKLRMLRPDHLREAKHRRLSDSRQRVARGRRAPRH